MIFLCGIVCILVALFCAHLSGHELGTSRPLVPECRGSRKTALGYLILGIGFTVIGVALSSGAFLKKSVRQDADPGVGIPAGVSGLNPMPDTYCVSGTESYYAILSHPSGPALLPRIYAVGLSQKMRQGDCFKIYSSPPPAQDDSWSP